MQHSVLLVASKPRGRVLAAWFHRTAPPGDMRAEMCHTQDLVARVRRRGPADTLLVDAQSVSGTGELRSIAAYVRRFWPQSCVIVVGDGGLADVVSAARAGAHGYLLFDSGARELTGAVADARERGFALPAEVRPARDVAGSGLTCPLSKLVGLTPRERDVARLMAVGMTNEEIGLQLGIGLETVRWHAKRVLGKLGVQRREQLIARWHTR